MDPLSAFFLGLIVAFLVAEIRDVRRRIIEEERLRGRVKPIEWGRRL